MKLVGYARVSTVGQSLNSQIERLTVEECHLIFRETMSGVSKDRPELRSAIETLEQGDVLVVTRLDRLARSTRDLLSIVDAVDAKGAKIKSLAEAWADTTTPSGKLILTVLGGLAEFERSLISERTAEGRERAKKEGRRLGRRPKLTQHQKDKVLLWRQEGLNNADIARCLGVSRSTISRISTI